MISLINAGVVVFGINYITTLLNAGAAIYASGISNTMKAGVDMAINIIESGAAKKKFEMLITHTQSFKN